MEYTEIIKQQLADAELSELTEILSESDAAGLFGGITPDGIVDSLLAGEPLFDTGAVVTGVRDLFFFELKSALLLGVEIVAVSILIGLLRSLSSSFGEKAVANLAMLTSTCVLIGLCLSNFMITFRLCHDAVGTMTHTMQILLPVLIPLLIATGSVASGNILNPVILGAVTALNTALLEFILPAVFVATVFFLINSMTEKDYVNRLAVFIRSVAVFACGACVTLFAGLTVLQGFVTEAADGLLLDTARFSISNLVPIVGNFAADSVDMILVCLRLVKNGIGIFGIIVLLALLLAPLIKILVIVAVYKLTAVVTEPLGNRKISECLDQMGNSAVTMAVILFLTSLMFLIFLAMIIGLGG